METRGDTEEALRSPHPKRPHCDVILDAPILLGVLTQTCRLPDKRIAKSTLRIDSQFGRRDGTKRRAVRTFETADGFVS